MKKVFATLLIASALCGCKEQLPYQDRTLSPEERAVDLVSRLTLEEKAALMQNNSPAVPRLGIKPYEWWNEALHGVGRAGLATVYPQAIGMGASFDEALLQEVFTSVSDEARVKNRLAREAGSYKRYQGLTFWTPNINIFRDPRWGRGQETYGEDPYLTGRLGTAVVRGLQGPEDSDYDKTHACAKHYAVHSGPEWNRHSFNAENIDPRDLHETYLAAFKDLVQKGGVQEVMCAYNRFEGDPCCGSDRLLTQILRNDWGYQGIVLSDCGAINDFVGERRHNTHRDAAHASAGAVLNGTDLECGSVYKALPEAVKRGDIKEEDIDRSVIRLMKARFELGEMDESTSWDSLPDSLLNSHKHQQLALKMARESMTLLQNRNGLLPLKEDMTVALIGPNANDSVMQWGNYAGVPAHTVTLLEALQQRLPAGRLIYVPACGHVKGEVFHSLFDECCNSDGKGFIAAYYNNVTLEGDPVAATHEPTPVQFNTDKADPLAPGVSKTDFSIAYRSMFYPKRSAKVAFRLAYLGDYELYINREQVAKGNGHKGTPATIYTLDAQEGKHYNIELRYIYKGNGVTQMSFDMGEFRQLNTPEVLKQVQQADVVLFAGGISPQLEGEEMSVDAPGFRGGDRTDIQLPAVQRDLVAALKKAGKRVVFINYSGSAVGLVPESRNCEAILQAWYPGQAGGRAIADVLYGDYNPAGRLPLTFYKDTLQLPDFQDYSMKGRTYRYMTQQPLFPFGHGLSYTTYAYGAPRLADGKLTFTVTNTGSRDGEEVVQLYLQRPADKNGPQKALRGFRRVAIPAGQSVEVSFDLDAETFNWWDEASNTMRPLAGEYRLLYGGSSADECLTAASYTYNAD